MFDSWDSFVATVNRAGFAWNDLLGQFAGKMWQPWTPIDSSGASLVLTSVAASYRRIGNEVNAIAAFTYPATANGANATLGGFPFACANLEQARAGTLNYHNGATAVKFLLDVNATTGHFYTAAGVNVTNAQMTTTLNYIQAIYRV